MPLAEQLWNLSYSGNGILPGADFTFGTFSTGYYLLDPVDIVPGDTAAGDTALPRRDGIRLGQDFKNAGATISFEIGVDTVDAAATRLGRHGANLAAVSRIEQAFDGEAVRWRFGTPAVLRTTQGGRARRFYGRPRKCAPAASRLTRQGYTPVVATFLSLDGVAYDDTEKSETVQINPPPRRGLKGPLTSPLRMTGTGATKVPGAVNIGGDRPTWPVITFHGPISDPACEVVGKWKVGLNLTIAEGSRVTIDTRPWALTVLRNGSASVAGNLTRASPRMVDMRLPKGRQDLVLRGADATGLAYMTVAWRDAYTYL
ncbi:phage tail family protein [Streptomyces sp. BV286]|uniref:phage tail family protein n=1 Tax=Streptomyces sp. BV286 TaxID=2849672 RepID=UPI001C2E25C5|nr:phage tail family protein [Streptomyces sp. BV286]MBV1940773.1 phage tail family protein [Streptomyces sp. BV286]